MSIFCFVAVAWFIFMMVSDHRRFSKEIKKSKMQLDWIIRTNDLREEASKVFNYEDAIVWLHTGTESLGGATPLEMCDTEEHYKEVVKILCEINETKRNDMNYFNGRFKC